MAGENPTTVVKATLNFIASRENIDYALDLGLIIDDRWVIRFANPMYECAVGRYLTRGVQDEVMMRVPENPWVSETGVDVAGLMAAYI